MPSDGKWVSPNEMMTAAKEHMLQGREPESEKDWALVLNFVAANILKGLEESICKIFVLLYEIPLDPETISGIAAFQAARKE